MGLNDRSCIADTSFLISLVDQSRTNYGVAAQYYRMILEQQVSMYFSAIVAAEFDVKQPITDLPLKNFRSIPFNVPHAREAPRLWNVLGKRDDGDTRHVVRDDVNLMLFSLQNFPFEHASNSRCTLGQWHKSTDFTVFSGWNAFAKLFSMLFYPPLTPCLEMSGDFFVCRIGFTDGDKPGEQPGNFHTGQVYFDY